MNRVQAITDAVVSKGIDGFLVSDLKNVRYLSGFSGSSGCLLITTKEKIFFTDFRYEEQTKKEVRGFDILIEKEERPKQVLKKAKSIGVKILGFETTVSYAFYRSLLKKGIRVKALSNTVEDMRKTKDRVELKFIAQAVERAQRAFIRSKPYIKRGVSERQIAKRLEENLRKAGCGPLPFDIIVASGPNSAMPHARPTDKKINAGDLVVIDWGGEAGGYFSDMTRTFVMRGRDTSKQQEIYETVLRANVKAIGSVREGVHARMVDKTARDVIRKEGFGQFFGHGTGHGVGLDVHELPRVSRLGREYLKAGMVFTIEPGVYLPGFGGVRIEDMVVAENKGRSVLTSIPKGFEIIH